MKPQQLKKFLVFSINNRFPVMIQGKPGVGKSDIVEQACKEVGANLIISHPVVSDPTDYKGLPFAENGEAHFLPFNDLNQLIHAKSPTVFFLDDLGQAPAAVQAACMQLILARKINGFNVSDEVTFIAATNRKEDKAGVTGILEPVKSRFASIVELEVNVDDWCKWAIINNMPAELIAFIRFRPELLDDFKPSKDMRQSPSPRTVTNVGKLQNANVDKTLEFEVFKGAAGEAFAAEYTAFLKVYRELPSVEEIILNPNSAKVPQETATKYALMGALSMKASEITIESILTYMDRVGSELTVACLQSAVIRNPKIARTKAFTNWSINNSNVLFDLN